MIFIVTCRTARAWSYSKATREPISDRAAARRDGCRVGANVVRKQRATQTWGGASGQSTIGCSDHFIIRASLVRQLLYFGCDERLPVVILRPDDRGEWLTTSNVEAARTMLQLYPAEDMLA